MPMNSIDTDAREKRKKLVSAQDGAVIHNALAEVARQITARRNAEFARVLAILEPKAEQDTELAEVLTLLKQWRKGG